MELILSGDVGDPVMVTQHFLADGQEDLNSPSRRDFPRIQNSHYSQEEPDSGNVVMPLVAEHFVLLGPNKPKIQEFRLRHQICLEPVFMEDLEVASWSDRYRKECLYGPRGSDPPVTP